MRNDLEVGDVVLISNESEVAKILWKRNRKLTDRESEIISLDWNPVSANWDVTDLKNIFVRVT
jgi:hypothetical protein